MVDHRQRQIQDEIDRVNRANQSAATRQHMDERNAFINNTPGYYTGQDQMECLTIQMYSMDDWNALFGGRPLQPAMLTYALACIANNIPLEVSVLLEMNAWPRNHEAIFIIYMPNHEQFYDGHMFEVEFSEGSHTHQTINRLFNTETRAVVQFMTQYDVLQFLADDGETANLLDRFLAGFNPVHYDDNHEVTAHDCAVFFGRDQDNDEVFDGPGPENNMEVAVRPPPPVNDFGAIFQEQLAQLDMEEGYNPQNDPNIIPYWLENNERINELIQMREERLRIIG